MKLLICPSNNKLDGEYNIVINNLVKKAVTANGIHIFDYSQPNPFLPHTEREQITALIPYQNYSAA